METTPVDVRSILTRCGGYLLPIASHSLNPYRGCALGNALCGVGCYVRNSVHVTKGRRWGTFVEVRQNAADVYRATVDRERRWARTRVGRFGIFMSSVTEPFQPAERKHRVTRSLLDAMLQSPPDALIVQTHSRHVVDEVDRLVALSRACALRVHVSIETDRERIPGLPPPASSVASRIEACRRLRAAGLFTVATVAPLLPIQDADAFFATLAGACDAVVIDHFVGGDGSVGGARTRRTPLPLAIESLRPGASTLAYRDEVVAIARRHVARVGVGAEGFAGRYGASDAVKPTAVRSDPSVVARTGSDGTAVGLNGNGGPVSATPAIG